MIGVLRGDGLWTATLNRPDKANALTRDMLETLADFAEEARGKARVLVLTGAGTVFSAGMDLEAARTGLPTDPVWERLSAALARFDGLSVAALNGTLAGGAFGMVLACDIRIAVAGATVFYPVMSRGFLPQPSDPARLTALIGPARAKMILMGGQKIAADEALAWGLVERVVPRDDLDAAVAQIAAPALGASAQHVAAIKRMLTAM